MGITYSVIDISKDAKNNLPTTYYGNGISLTRKDNPKIITSYGRNEKQPLENYKQYRHKLPESGGWSPTSYELRAVNHGNNKQEGLETKGKFERYREVSVLYWLNDNANIFPLIIGLCEYNVNYFKRDNETTNEWKEAGISHPATIPEYKNVLEALNKTFSDVVIVNLNAENGQKYCGHPSKDGFKSPNGNPESCSQNGNSFVTITVSEINGTVPSGFKCLKHSPSGNKMRVLGTYHNTSFIQFKDSVVATECKYLNVYYTSGNRSGKPLLLELSNGADQGTSKFYTLGNNGWMLSTYSPSDLTKALDQENCLRNDIVVADLSNKRGRYCCGMNGHRKIQVEWHRNHIPAGYTSYMHLPNGASFNIRRFKNGNDTYTFSNLSGRITGIYAYFCNKDTSRALLIYVNKGSGYGGTWFKGTSGGSNTWTEAGMDSLQRQTPSSPSIIDSIRKELNKICKELQITCQHAPEGAPAVPSSSGGLGGSSGSSGSGGSGSSGGGSTSVSSLPGAGIPGPSTAQPAGIDGEGSGPTVDGELEAKSKRQDEEASPEIGATGPGDGAGPGSVTDSIQKFFQKALTFIKSHYKEIAPPVGGVLGTGILGVLVWKWPNIMSFLITRL